MVSQLEQSIRDLDYSKGTIAEIATATAHVLNANRETAKQYLRAKRNGFESFSAYGENCVQKNRYESFYKYKIAKIKARYGSLHAAATIRAIKKGYDTKHEDEHKHKRLQKAFEERMELRPLEKLDIERSDLQEKIRETELIKKMRKAMNALSIKQKYVIEKRYFENKTLEEIGKETQVTHERIRQLEQGALAKLRRLIAA